MPYPHDNNGDNFILNAVNDPIIADTDAVQPLLTMQCFNIMRPRIVGKGENLSVYTFPNFMREGKDLLPRNRQKNDPVFHESPISLRMAS